MIQGASGLSYAEYMRRRVFIPLGLRRTFVETPDSLRGDLALGYGYENGAYTPQRYEYYASTPASSIDASAADMGQLMIALLGDGANSHGRLFSAAMAQRIKTVQFAAHPRVPVYSYGFWETTINEQRLISHGGDMLGYESDLFLIPEHRIGVYVVYNHNGEAGGLRPQLRLTLRAALIARWFPLPAPTPPAPLPIDTKRFEGAYGESMYCHHCLEGEGWAMPPFSPVRSIAPGVLEVDGQRLLAVDSLLFVFERNPRRKVAFVPDDHGEIAYAYWPREGSARERRNDRLLAEVLGPNWREGPPHPLAARVFRDTGRWSECASTYGSLVALHPQNGRSAFFGGQCALRAGRIAEALALLGRAWDLNQWRNHSAYQLGSAYARTGNADSAFAWLRRAVELQFPNLGLFDTDPNLESIRSDPRFAALRKPNGD
jgi:hypothetical protein